MTAAELKKLVLNGESQFLEFKKKADHPEKIVREMVAFANSEGGTLLIGVDDRGNISGLPFPDEDTYAMEAAISMYSKPALEYTLDSIPVGEGKKVLRYRVQRGKEKPYYWLSDKEKKQFTVYVRSKDQSLKASYEVYRILRDAEEKSGILELGKSEQDLFAHLARIEKTSILDFAIEIGIGKKKVSAMFIRLIKQGVLEIEPGEHFDLFKLSMQYKVENNQGV